MSRKLDLKLNLSLRPARRSAVAEEDCDEAAAAAASPSSCLSTERELLEEEEAKTTASMVVAGCPRCLMYVMLAEDDMRCPKCRSTVLIDFSHGGSGGSGGSNRRKKKGRSRTNDGSID